MQADLPHTLYLSDKGSGKKGAKRKRSQNYKYNKNDPAIEKQLAAIQKAEERRAAKVRGDAPYTTEELFRK